MKLKAKKRRIERLLMTGVKAALAARAPLLERAGSVLEEVPRLSACKFKVVGSAGQKFCKDFNRGRCWRAAKEASRCSEGLHRCSKVLPIGKACCAKKHGAVDCSAVW